LLLRVGSDGVPGNKDAGGWGVKPSMHEHAAMAAMEHPPA
jgi:hypothetical protein